MTAIELGQEMLGIPTDYLPPLAVEHLKYLSNKYGMCLEACLTAFTVYAQIVEGLECNDILYIPDIDSIEWYAKKGYQYRKE